MARRSDVLCLADLDAPPPARRINAYEVAFLAACKGLPNKPPWGAGNRLWGELPREIQRGMLQKFILDALTEGRMELPCYEREDDLLFLDFKRPLLEQMLGLPEDDSETVFCIPMAWLIGERTDTLF